MDYFVFLLHLIQVEGNNKKIELKNILDQILSGICAPLYRHILNCTLPKIFGETTVTLQKLMKQFSCCRLGARNMHFRVCMVLVCHSPV